MKKGIYLVLLTAIISGFSSFLNKFGMQAVAKNAYQYAMLKNVIVALVLSWIILSPVIWSKLKRISKGDWSKLVLIGLVGGSIPFLLFFQGLSMTSSINAAFIHKTLFIWVIILAWPVLKERVTKLQFLALATLFIGNVIFLGLRGMSWGYAETIILLATILWSVENIIAKIVLKNVDALVLAWARMFFGSIFLFGFLTITNNVSGLLDLSVNQFGWLVLMGVFLLGYIATWYSALKRLPVTVVASFLVIASPITTLLNSIFITHTIDVNKIVGLVVMIAALIIFWRFSNLNIQSHKSEYCVK
jgi:drug/metabolite transporter (DMT)-like permease